MKQSNLFFVLLLMMSSAMAQTSSIPPRYVLTSEEQASFELTPIIYLGAMHSNDQDTLLNKLCQTNLAKLANKLFQGGAPTVILIEGMFAKVDSSDLSGLIARHMPGFDVPEGVDMFGVDCRNYKSSLLVDVLRRTRDSTHLETNEALQNMPLGDLANINFADYFNNPLVDFTDAERFVLRDNFIFDAYTAWYAERLARQGYQVIIIAGQQHALSNILFGSGFSKYQHTYIDLTAGEGYYSFGVVLDNVIAFKTATDILGLRTTLPDRFYMRINDINPNLRDQLIYSDYTLPYSASRPLTKSDSGGWATDSGNVYLKSFLSLNKEQQEGAKSLTFGDTVTADYFGDSVAVTFAVVGEFSLSAILDHFAKINSLEVPIVLPYVAFYVPPEIANPEQLNFISFEKSN